MLVYSAAQIFQFLVNLNSCYILSFVLKCHWHATLYEFHLYNMILYLPILQMTPTISLVTISAVQFSCSVLSDFLQPHGLQHARLPCPSPTPGAYSNSCPSSWWWHPTISSSVVPFSSCLQSCPASGSFPMSQFFASGGQSIRVSAPASVLPMKIQDWFL